MHKGATMHEKSKLMALKVHCYMKYVAKSINLYMF